MTKRHIKIPGGVCPPCARAQHHLCTPERWERYQLLTGDEHDGCQCRDSSHNEQQQVA